MNLDLFKCIRFVFSNNDIYLNKIEIRFGALRVASHSRGI